MDLVEVDVVGAEPAQAGVDLGHDRLARQAARRSGPSRIRPMHLGGDTTSSRLGEILQRAADDLLARAVGIDVGGVEEVDAELERALDERPALLLVERPRMRAAVGPP